MGQYFNPVIVDPTGRPLAALNPATYGAGPKLSTHTRADSPLHSTTCAHSITCARSSHR